jgi:hypothetical protein
MIANSLICATREPAARVPGVTGPAGQRPSVLRPGGLHRSPSAWRTIEDRLSAVADDASLLIGLRAQLDRIRSDRA